MKNQQLQTKRQTKTGFRKLHAKVTSPRRKQRVSASANPEMLDSDVPNASIARVLTIILLLHVVAIAAVLIGVQWSKDRNVIPESADTPSGKVDLRNLNAEMPTGFAIAGDSYASFAARYNVDESELRIANNDALIHAGKPLFIPPTKIKVAPVAVAVSDRPALPDSNTVVQLETPRAEVVTPNVVARAVLVPEDSGRVYKVQSGDSIWRISKKHNVDQKALMALNNLKAARDLKAGMTLQIPAQ